VLSPSSSGNESPPDSPLGASSALEDSTVGSTFGFGGFARPTKKTPAQLAKEKVKKEQFANIFGSNEGLGCVNRTYHICLWFLIILYRLVMKSVQVQRLQWPPFGSLRLVYRHQTNKLKRLKKRNL
jgi:hypothetical protein